MLQKHWAQLLFKNYFDGEGKLELPKEKHTNTSRKKLLAKKKRED